MRTKTIVISLLALTIIFTGFKVAHANNNNTLKCVDGDTFAIGQTYYRLSYMDTPEKGQHNYKKSSNFTCDWLSNNKFILELHGLDKYGRTLVVVWKLQRSYTDATPGVSLNEILIKKCLAEPFYGKTTKETMDLYYNNCK